jgi:hypothetical protein
MSLHRHLYRVTDAASAFKPIIGGYGEEPTTGFKPWAAVTVSADYILEKTIPPRPPTKPRFKGYPGGTATYH